MARILSDGVILTHLAIHVLGIQDVIRADNLLDHPNQVNRVLAEGKVSHVLRRRRADLFFLKSLIQVARILADGVILTHLAIHVLGIQDVIKRVDRLLYQNLPRKSQVARILEDGVIPTQSTKHAFGWQGVDKRYLNHTSQEARVLNPGLI